MITVCYAKCSNRSIDNDEKTIHESIISDGSDLYLCTKCEYSNSKCKYFKGIITV